MYRSRIIRLAICLIPLVSALLMCPLAARALPDESDITLSGKGGSFQTGDQMSFSAAFSYEGAPNTPGSVQYRPVTWTITNMNIGACQYAAANQGIELTASGNYTLLVSYNAYAYDSDAGLYNTLVGGQTVSIPITVTDSVIPNTIDVAEIEISILIILFGVGGAVVCIGTIRRHA